MKALFLVLDQQSDNVPTIRYQENQLGFSPSLSRNFAGMYTINLQQAFPSVEGRLFVTSNPSVRYQSGATTPQIEQVTSVLANDIDGEVYIENKINGQLADGISGFQIIIYLKD